MPFMPCQNDHNTDKYILQSLAVAYLVVQEARQALVVLGGQQCHYHSQQDLVLPYLP